VAPASPVMTKWDQTLCQALSFYLRKADECVIAAKAATLNEERARHYSLAEHYMRLAMDELS
jgi:hypothetical protein